MGRSLRPVMEGDRATQHHSTRRNMSQEVFTAVTLASTLIVITLVLALVFRLGRRAFRPTPEPLAPVPAAEIYLQDILYS